MPRGWRLRPGGGPRRLGMVAGVLLVLALVVTGRVLDGPDPRYPVQPPGTTAAPAPYRVGERAACYGTAAEAAAAGYAEAPLPAGALNLGGVYLVPVPHGVRRACRRAAERLGFPVPCPRLLPVPSLGTPPAVCPPPCGEPGFGFLLEDSGFVVPSGYVGAYPEVGRRLVLAAARRPAAAAVACAGGRPVSRPDVRGHDADLLQCPPGAGPHRDGLLLRWRERGVFVAVSVTGQATERRLVLALAANLELVPPGR